MTTDHKQSKPWQMEEEKQDPIMPNNTPASQLVDFIQKNLQMVKKKPVPLEKQKEQEQLSKLQNTTASHLWDVIQKDWEIELRKSAVQDYGFERLGDQVKSKEEADRAINMLMDVYTSLCKLDGLTYVEFVTEMDAACKANDLESGLRKLWRHHHTGEFRYLEIFLAKKLRIKTMLQDFPLIEPDEEQLDSSSSSETLEKEE